MSETKAEPQSGQMNLRELVADWLRSHGYDGLYYSDHACGCKLDELMPCDEPVPTECEPGFLATCDPETCENGGGCPWHIGPRKEPSRG